MTNLKREIKVKIKNEKEFRQIQEKVFKEGGVWYGGEKLLLRLSDFGNLDFFGIAIDYDDYESIGYDLGLNITYSDREEDFNDLDNIELSFEEVMKIENLKDYILNKS